MCEHLDVSSIEEGLTEERWEGDFYTQNIFDWVLCNECGVDFCCKAA
jgi:hypothetical protein